MPNGQIVTFSAAREPIKMGLLRAMLRKAGLTEEEFQRLLGGRAVMEYVLVIHRAEEGGYWTEVPALAGCFAQADTLDELLDEAREAIASHMEALREDGRPEPEATMIATVRMPERSPTA